MDDYDRLIGAIYDGVEDLRNWEEAFSRLGSMTGCRGAGVFAYHEAVLCELTHGMPDGFMAAFSTECASTDPRLLETLATGSQAVMNDAEPELRRRMRKAGTDDFLQQWDLPYTAARLLLAGDEEAWSLFVSRSRSQGPIDDSTAAMLERLAPHFIRALGFRRRWVGRSPDRLDGPYPIDGPRLSTRQHEVLRLLGDGLTNKQIAAILGCATDTVRNHVHALLDRLGAATRTACVAVARRHGLL